MTTIDAAAATRATKARDTRSRSSRSWLLAGFSAVCGLVLAGCETGTSILGQAGPTGPQTQLATPAPSASSSLRLAVAPVIGPSEPVAKQMQTSLSGALAKQNVAVIPSASDKSDYTLRGYVVSAREKSGVKVSYIWDLTDSTGQRVNRITGEEIIANAPSRDPWSAVSPQVIDAIASKTAGQVAAWAPGHSSTTGNIPVAAATPAAAAAPTQTAAATPSQGPTTGSIGRAGSVTAFVPNVTGAPGDGRISLTSALQRELSRSGVSLANNTGGPNYRVEGVVDIGQTKDGKQPIKIDWHVKDPNGKKIGTVSQKNEIAAGSLDGAWGATADAAAAAAAQGILKLLPQKN